MIFLVIDGRPGPAYIIVALDAALHMSSSRASRFSICSSTLERSTQLLNLSRKDGSVKGSRHRIFSLADIEYEYILLSEEKSMGKISEISGHGNHARAQSVLLMTKML